MKKVLITGAAGYLGSMLTTELVSLNYEVLAVDLMKYDKNSLSHLFKFKNFKFLKEDITKDEVIKKIVKKQEFIIPLAAIVGAPLCQKYKKKTIQTNVQNNLFKQVKTIQKKISNY